MGGRSAPEDAALSLTFCDANTGWLGSWTGAALWTLDCAIGGDEQAAGSWAMVGCGACGVRCSGGSLGSVHAEKGAMETRVGESRGYWGYNGTDCDALGLGGLLLVIQVLSASIGASSG